MRIRGEALTGKNPELSAVCIAAMVVLVVVKLKMACQSGKEVKRTHIRCRHWDAELSRCDRYHRNDHESNRRYCQGVIDGSRSAGRLRYREINLFGADTDWCAWEKWGLGER